MSWAVATAMALAFVAIFRFLRLIDRGREVFRIGSAAVDLMRDAKISDLEKERRIQTYSLRLLKLLVILVGGGLTALVLPLLVVWGLGAAAIVDYDEVLAVATSASFLIVGGVVAVLLFWWFERRPGMAFEHRYSLIDRVLHRVAFATRPAQAALADIESRIFSDALATVRVDRPVFITGLPRAGTTILLEIIVATGEFVSHTYRDMPFVMLPMLWSRFSQHFRRSDERRERAHGDGILVSVDSPEAFEEIVWLTFWSSQYAKDRILPWDTTGDADFEYFFREHIRKIVALRGSEEATARRYVSKNNLNIARAEYLKKILPDAVIIVPFRTPGQHAASLLKQHLNFLRIHSRDPFASAYMKGLGHFDFGMNLMPVDFGNWLASSSRDASTLEFWIQYWTSAYGYLYDACADRVLFLSYERLCKSPRESLRALAAVLGMDSPERLVAQSTRLAARNLHDEGTGACSPETLARAEQLYKRLCDRDQITRL
jgi:hypothetical protein